MIGSQLLGKNLTGGAVQCRTVESGGAAIEAIPEELIIKAAVLATTELIAKPERKCGCS